MGIKRLYSYIKEVFRPAKLDELEGKKIGIDAMCMLY